MLGSSAVTVPNPKAKAVKYISDHSEQRLLVVKGGVHQVCGNNPQQFHKIPEDIFVSVES